MSNFRDFETQGGIVGFTHMFKGIDCTESEYGSCCGYFNSKPMVGKEEVSDYLNRLRYEKTHPKSEPTVANSVEATLAQRGSRYGDFTDHAAVCQDIKRVMLNTNTIPGRGFSRLADVQKQALEVIADKIARILTGDPNYDDNWHDIQGYAKLAEDRLPCNQNKSAK